MLTHILLSSSRQSCCLATSKVATLFICTTKSWNPKRLHVKRLWMTAAWVNSRQRLTEVQKTEWTFLYYSWLGHPRELNQRRYLAAPLTCHTGLNPCQTGIFCFHLYSNSVTSHKFLFTGIYLSIYFLLSFIYVSARQPVFTLINRCWWHEVQKMQVTIIRSNEHSSVCVSKDCFFNVPSFKLQFYCAHPQLIRQHCCPICLPACRDGTAVCGRVLSPVQCGRERKRHKHHHTWQTAHLLHFLQSAF